MIYNELPIRPRHVAMWLIGMVIVVALLTSVSRGGKRTVKVAHNVAVMAVGRIFDRYKLDGNEFELVRMPVENEESSAYGFTWRLKQEWASRYGLKTDVCIYIYVDREYFMYHAWVTCDERMEQSPYGLGPDLEPLLSARLKASR